MFVRNAGTWSQQAYLKASNTGAFDHFGESVAVSGDTVVVIPRDEDSNATGVNGDQTNNSANAAGAAYVFGLGPSVVAVVIDIKPGDDPNSINVNDRNKNAVIPVAILSDAGFDASSVDPSTVAFGPNGAVIAHASGHIDDVNADGFPDLLLHFKTVDTGIACGDTSATLTGTTFGGESIEGMDSVNPVPCQ